MSNKFLDYIQTISFVLLLNFFNKSKKTLCSLNVDLNVLIYNFKLFNFLAALTSNCS